MLTQSITNNGPTKNLYGEDATGAVAPAPTFGADVSAPEVKAVKSYEIGGETLTPGTTRDVVRNGVSITFIWSKKGRGSMEYTWKPLFQEDGEGEEVKELVSAEDVCTWLDDDAIRMLHGALSAKVATDFSQKYGDSSDKFLEGYGNEKDSLFKKAVSAKAADTKKIKDYLGKADGDTLSQFAAFLEAQGGDGDAVASALKLAKQAAEDDES